MPDLLQADGIADMCGAVSDGTKTEWCVYSDSVSHTYTGRSWNSGWELEFHFLLLHLIYVEAKRLH